MTIKNSSLPWVGLDKKIRVAVVGDIILDEYLEGQVSRISPEAPVPVHLVSKTVHRAGGAANVALNVHKAGGEVSLIGVWGADAAAADLKSLLEGHGVSTANVVEDLERPTIKKTRISANRQQIVRVDWEKVQPVGPEIENKLIAQLENIKCDALLVSDYGKGGLTSSFIKHAINICEKRQIKVVIDPKGADYSRYQGAYAITPNRKEACLALGLDPTDFHERTDLARGLQEKFKLRNILLTLGSDGMYFCPEKGSDQKELFYPAQAREVFDVSGAGDTVAAMFALGLASKISLAKTTRIANLAAGVVVGKWGTQPIRQAELELAIQMDDGGPASYKLQTTAKIKTKEELLTTIGQVESRVRKTVFTNGCFDILHAGHVEYLEKARACGDQLIVAVNSDSSVSRLKGASRPIVALEHRLKLIAALSFVDHVVSFDEDTPKKLIEFLTPNVLIKGADYQPDQIVGADHVIANGGKVDTIELVDGVSTSQIIEKIKKGNE